MSGSYDLLNPDDISRGVGTGRVGRRVVVFKSTSSTNDIAWSYSGNKSNDGLAVFAEHQSGGRGRRGNVWFGGEGVSLLFSVLLVGEQIKRELITLLCGVAVAEVLVGRSVRHVQLKWPNDVLVDGSKMAGVLVESRGDDVVLGVGMNCHQVREDFEFEINRSATSLDIESGRVCNRNAVGGELLNSIDKWLKIAATDKEQVVSKWQNFSSLLGTRVGIEYNNESYFGNCIGLDPESGLILHLDGGGVRMFDAVHSSILKS